MRNALARLNTYVSFGTVPRYDRGIGYQAWPPSGLVDDDVHRTWWLRSRISARQRPEWLALDGTAGGFWAALPTGAALDDPNVASSDQLGRGLRALQSLLWTVPAGGAGLEGPPPEATRLLRPISTHT
jgi:hypothetical protein